jgi:hypothetical protein
MKIISLWQPWASLWVAGAKMVETRSWATTYRGPVAVHAAKHWDESLAALCRTEPFKSVLERLGYNDAPMGHRASLPFGKILGSVELVDCLQMVDLAVGENGWTALERHGGISLVDDPRLTPNERAFGRYEKWRWAWVTGSTRRRLAEPIPYRGAQGLRDLPAEIAARLTL